MISAVCNGIYGFNLCQPLPSGLQYRRSTRGLLHFPLLCDVWLQKACMASESMYGYMAFFDAIAYMAVSSPFRHVLCISVAESLCLVRSGRSRQRHRFVIIRHVQDQLVELPVRRYYHESVYLLFVIVWSDSTARLVIWVQPSAHLVRWIEEKQEISLGVVPLLTRY